MVQRYGKLFCRIILILISLLLFVLTEYAQQLSPQLHVNEQDYFETRGLNILVFSNWYDGNFDDSKISGVEIIHHGVRTATNGDVRLSPTPEQWDPIPQFVERKVDRKKGTIEAYLKYPKYKFQYKIKAKAVGNGISLSVDLEKPLPEELEGKAGFNLEFLPSAYFEKTYLMDEKSGVFPLYPSGPMERTRWETVEACPLAIGKHFILAPEDSEKRITIQTKEGELSLYDGRNKAQNGWYVIRSLIPSNKSGKVIEWFITANTTPNWIRKPVITHSQVGYHPAQKKIAVIELDPNDNTIGMARLLKVNGNGEFIEKYKCDVSNWGKYLRYNYVKFDFSSIEEEGIYVIEYGASRTNAFRIDPNVYENAWHPTLDVFFPVQMDHMYVNEAYRVWHGASHLDDALQAPINHEHFDLYAQGPTTDSPFKPGEHIPGLNIGGWYDAGDHDIRTQTQYGAVLSLVQIWEQFKIMRDETTINQKTRYVDIHRPDGIPDILQQIEHGTLQLVAQHKAVGHAISGIIPHTLDQYTHLGDAVTISDNLIYNSKLDSLQSDGFTSGTFDDRWAFTSKSTSLNFGSIAALAAASRALRGYNDTLADECFATVKKVWDDEHSHAPDLFRFGNTSGSALEEEELKAAVELLVCTKENKYAIRIIELLDKYEDRFGLYAANFARALPYMEKSYVNKIEKLVVQYKYTFLDRLKEQNPFGVIISTGGWAGSGFVVGSAITNYYLHKAFPMIIDKEYVFAGLNYLYGCHPGSNISFVSGAGTHSKKIGYGNNRADFSFIAGGIVPGVLILKPDYPENKEDWPFLWGENEYVIGLAPSYIYLVNAVNDLLKEGK